MAEITWYHHIITVSTFFSATPTRGKESIPRMCLPPENSETSMDDADNEIDSSQVSKPFEYVSWHFEPFHFHSLSDNPHLQGWCKSLQNYFGNILFVALLLNHQIQISQSVQFFYFSANPQLFFNSQPMLKSTHKDILHPHHVNSVIYNHKMSMWCWIHWQN